MSRFFWVAKPKKRCILSPAKTPSVTIYWERRVPRTLQRQEWTFCLTCFLHLFSVYSRIALFWRYTSWPMVKGRCNDSPKGQRPSLRTVKLDTCGQVEKFNNCTANTTNSAWIRQGQQAACTLSVCVIGMPLCLSREIRKGTYRATNDDKCSTMLLHLVPPESLVFYKAKLRNTQTHNSLVIRTWLRLQVLWTMATWIQASTAIANAPAPRWFMSHRPPKVCF